MYTTAEDWLDRFKAAGFSLTIDGVGIRPLEGAPRSPECMELWDEIRGAGNEERWNDVVALVRQRVGAFTGWTEY